MAAHPEFTLTTLKERVDGEVVLSIRPDFHDRDNLAGASGGAADLHYDVDRGSQLFAERIVGKARIGEEGKCR